MRSGAPRGTLELGAVLFACTLLPQKSNADEPGNDASSAAEEAPALPKHIYADAFLTWIYTRPERDPAPLGYIRAGDSVPLRAEGQVPAGVRIKRGCGKGWYAVEPAGYVCLDHTASLRPTLYTKNMGTLAPRPGPYPFDFALSMGSPSYRRIPTEAEWLRKERVFGEARPRALPPHWRGHEELVTDETLPLAALPSYLAEKGSISREVESRLVRRDVPFGSMLAASGSFESGGRQFLRSADGTVVPADRFRVFRRSTFEGVKLSSSGAEAARLPLAWPRKRTKAYLLAASADCALPNAEASAAPGKLEARPVTLKASCLLEREKWVLPKSVLALSGRTVDIAGTRFVESVQAGSVAPSTWVPLGSMFLAEQRARQGMAGTATKWIHFTIGQGTLVVYEGEQAIFATLASPGIGGVPNPGADPLSTRTTPVGTYRIQFKHRTDDMSPEQTEERSYWIADVPHAMYFQQPFAIHVAYWHESFGEPMSGGCINVSPRDGEYLFSFADPPLPDGWYGVSASTAFGPGTTVVIDR